MAAIRPTQSLLRNKAWLGGAWTSAINGGTFPVFNPSTGEKIEDVPDMNEDDVEIAIREAYRAQKTWGTTIAKVTRVEASEYITSTRHLLCSYPE